MSDVKQLPSEAVPSAARSGKHLRGVTRTARFAGVLLLVVWVGPVTWIQTDAWRLMTLVGAPESAHADSDLIPAGKAILLQPDTRLVLRMRDGSVRKGYFLGRALLDSALYTPRFWPGATHVAVEDVETVRVSSGSGASVAGIVVLSVLGGALLALVLIGVALNSAEKECGSNFTPPSLLGIHLITRPFDRSRGCYVGDPPLAADPWPGAIVEGTATAAAEPEMSPLLAK